MPSGPGLRRQARRVPLGSDAQGWVQAIHLGSASDPWSPVVDELQPLVMRSCGLAPEKDVTCLLVLSSSHPFKRHLALMCPRCALTLRSVASSFRTFGTVLLTVKRCSLARMRRSAQDSRSVCGLLYLAAAMG